MGNLNFQSRIGIVAAAFAAFLFSVAIAESRVEASPLGAAEAQAKYIQLDAKGAPHLVSAPTAAPAAAMQDVIAVRALTVSGNDIYVGGEFTSIGGIAANYVARYNIVSQRWFALGADLGANGNGVRGGFVSTITVVGNEVFVAGSFSGADNRNGQFVSANCVARWNTATSTWSALGTGVGPQKNGFNGDVISSVAANGKVYFVGTFKSAFNSASTSVEVNQVAAWNIATSTWLNLAKGLGAASTYEIFDVAVMGDNLYIGGNFPAVYRADNSILHVACIARWSISGNNWFAMGVESNSANSNGAGGDVYALATDGTYLYVGGFFSFVKNSVNDKPPASNLARWNGTTWSTLNGSSNVDNNGTDQVVKELCFNSGMLYVAGDFEHVKNTNGTTTFASYLARWNGTSWSLFGGAAVASGNGVNNEVHSLVVGGGQVYVGGRFNEAYNNTGNMVPVNCLARWTGTLWTGVSSSAIKALSSVSAASYAPSGDASVDSIVAAFGTTLATGTRVGNTVPLATNLLGTSVDVRDSAGTSRPAQLFFVSAGQINFLVPAGTALGTATITVNSGDGSQSQGTLNIVGFAPGMFTFNANGNGVPAAQILRIKANNVVTYESLATIDSATSKWVATPIDLGPVGDRVFLIAYGTGIRGRGATPATMKIGGTDATVTFAGAQGGLTGVDQINAEIPRSLIGRNSVDVVLSLGAKNANTVTINIK